MGDKSIVPFSGGMMPLNKFRYGSQSVLHIQKISVREVWSAVYILMDPLALPALSKQRRATSKQL